MAASQTLRAALSKVEAAHPGFSYDLVLGLVKKADANSVNMNESLLRLQGAVQDQDCKKFYIFNLLWRSKLSHLDNTSLSAFGLIPLSAAAFLSVVLLS